MKSRGTSCTLVVLAFLMLGFVGAREAAADPPKLVVLLVVDQMRGDYVARYGHQWTKGLHRLVSQGAWFSRAGYPYANTVTCTGHATISTGTFPATHGITGNSWFDSAEWRSVACSDVPGVTSISYGRPVTGANGPQHLRASTLADELRGQLPGPTRVVTMSVKARSAVMLAGRRAEAVTWFSPTAKGLVTSSHYTKGTVPFVEAFGRANPIDRDLSTPWTRALPVERYLFTDDGVGEAPPAFWTRTFPHAFGDASAPEAWAAWESSPRSDAYLGRLAASAVEALKLGQGAGTDFLGVSFSALDLVGHDFGPQSHEVQDVLVRLDETVGALLEVLDRLVGPDAYVVGFSSDHGVAAIPERLAADGLDAGRVPSDTIVKAAQQALQATLGPGTYRVRLHGADLVVEPAVSDALRAKPEAAAAVVRALRALPAVGVAYHAAELAQAAAAGDRDARAAWLGYHPGRSGDFVVYPRPHWLYVYGDGILAPGEGTSHGLPYTYDQHVPVILFGAGVRPGEYRRPATPADLAPTLAALCGIALPRPDGEVLVDALLPAGPARSVR